MEKTRISRIEIITQLKNKFPLNNPSSWGRNSNKQLIEWYCEYINTTLEPKNVKIF